MFLTRRPSPAVIKKFLADSKDLLLSYSPVGIAKGPTPGFKFDEVVAVLGRGPDIFARATQALCDWRHFDLGWVELYPKRAAIAPGTVVAVLARHLGIWSLNGCRVVYLAGDPESDQTFGFAYGTLTNHVEMGEEIFEVAFAPETEVVTYRIAAISKPRAALARIGYPAARMFQSRFRRDSIRAMQKAVG